MFCEELFHDFEFDAAFDPGFGNHIEWQVLVEFVQNVEHHHGLAWRVDKIDQNMKIKYVNAGVLERLENVPYQVGTEFSAF